LFTRHFIWSLILYSKPHTLISYSLHF